MFEHKNKSKEEILIHPDSSILTKEKCKVSELLLLCKEDPDSVINIYKTVQGDQKCLPEIELDADELDYFERNYENQEFLHSCKPVKQETREDVLNYSKTSHKSVYTDESAQIKRGILKIEERCDEEESKPVKTILKNPQHCYTTKYNSMHNDMNLSNNQSKSIKKSVTITEYVDICSLLPKVNSPLLHAVNNNSRRSAKKVDKMKIVEEGPPDGFPPIITYSGDSPAVALLRKVINEQKVISKLEDRTSITNNTQDSRYVKKSNLWKNFTSYFKQKPHQKIVVVNCKK